MPRYNPSVIEPKWQAFWETNKTFAAPRLPTGPKMYILDMFPYPSGDGLHVGHPEGQTATDILARYWRMRGKCVLHPMGWDAFGLPAEQHAIKTGTPPRITTEKNIATFRRQEKMLGFSYDWDRELSTTDDDYLRWTQWIFLVIYDTWFDTARQKGRPIAELPIPPDVSAQGDLAVRKYRDSQRLAYQLEAPVNWCPALGTVLANEEIIGGVSERGGHAVTRIPLRQWMLKITAYGDRLEQDLDGLDWTESIKSLQRNWIGRSTGAEVDFYIGPMPVDVNAERDPRPAPVAFKSWRTARSQSGFPRQPGDDVIRVYTTRPDTLFGATYMVISPEHPLVERLTLPEQRAAVQAYIEQASRKSDLDRTDLAKEKTGVFTGSLAVNPVNNRPVPIWIADYVLASYGTGAIMAVPAHDVRDFEFAQQFQLPIVPVVDPGTNHADLDRAAVLDGRACFAGHGVSINSSAYSGLSTSEFKAKIIADLARQGYGREAVNYKLRDWLFSRQHFWGEPFPILHEIDEHGTFTGLSRAVDLADLPVNLPEMSHFKPHGRPEPPLEEASPDWLYVTIDGQRYKRETNSMPQWAGSCWYYLRYLDNRNDQQFIDPEIERAWMPVDIYIGGAEHAVLHLLYARFWHKVLFDRGHVSMVEPFQRLVNQGMILGEVEFTGYQRADRSWISAAQVVEGDNRQFVIRETGEEATPIKLSPQQATKQGDSFVLAQEPSIRIESRANKMSKSRGNVVNPDLVVKEYGADALRLYEMFMGPLEATKPWSMEGVSGVRNFLDRVWRMIVNDRAEQIELSPNVREVTPNEEQNRVLHRTIRDVTQDIERLSFNTAIAKMMEFTNFFMKVDARPRSAMSRFVHILSPFAPHLSEELWQLLGHRESLAYEPWPTYDEGAIKEASIEVPVQILGKLRGRVSVSAEATEAELESAAKGDPKIAELLAGKTIVKAIVVKGKMVNFVVK